MQFTPQQLAGAQRYGSKTRVGNWAEDRCLEETKLSDFRASQTLGTLMMNDVRSKDVTYNARVPLPPCDGLARFGDTIMLQSHRVRGAALAVDLTEPLFESDGGSRLVTAMAVDAAGPEAVARNTFVILPLEGGRGASKTAAADAMGRPVRYGEPFRLACSEALCRAAGTPYYLSSTLKNERNASRISNQQSVFMTSSVTLNSVWSFEKLPSAGDNKLRCGVARMLAAGECVPAFPARASSEEGAPQPVVIQHRGTKQAASVNPKFVDCSDFGAELEVSCHNNYGARKVEALSSEIKGKTTGATNARLEGPENWWVVLAGEPSKHSSRDEAKVSEDTKEEISEGTPRSYSKTTGEEAKAADPSSFSKNDAYSPPEDFKEEDPPPFPKEQLITAELSEALAGAKRAVAAAGCAADLVALANEVPGELMSRGEVAAQLALLGVDALDTVVLDAFDEGNGSIHLPTFVGALLEAEL